MVLKAVNWVHSDKIGHILWFERSHLGIQVQKSVHIVLKEVNWVHYDKIRLNGLERSQFGTQ